MKLLAGGVLALCACALSAHARGDSVLPTATVMTLDNGTRLQLVEKHDVPVVVLQATLAGGALADPPGREGASALLAEWLEKGAGDRDALEFAEAVENVGGELEVHAGLEALSVAAKFLAEDAPLMVELVADALQDPQLETDEFDKLRERAIDRIAAEKDGDPSGLLPEYANAWLLPGQPYGRPVGGDEATLAALTPEDLRTLYRRQLGAERLTLTVVGDFATDAMRDLLAARFSAWRRAEGAAPSIAETHAGAPRRVLLVDKPGSTQTYFAFGSVGPSRLDADRAIQDLANTQFGGRFTSLLNTELRIKSGLSYGASSRLARLRLPGPLRISSFTATETTAQALALTIETLERYRETGMDADTLKSVRQYNLGRFPFSLETADDIAGIYAELALYGLPASDIDAYLQQLREATLEQVNAETRRLYPAPDGVSLVLIGDADQVRDIAAEYGAVTEMGIADAGFYPPEAEGRR